MRFRKSLWLLPSLLAASLVAGVVWAAGTWEDPTAAPTGGNQDRPINVGSVPQEKTGYLMLSNSSNPGNSGELWFRLISNGARVSLKANSATANSYSLTLPTTAGTNNDVLQTDGNGVLHWVDPSSISGLDPDWKYNNAIPTDANTITNDSYFTRIGDGGAPGYTSNIGDLYVQHNTEIDGNIYALGANTVSAFTQVVAGGTGGNSNSVVNILANAGQEGLRIRSAGNWSPLNIVNQANTDIFRVNQSGVLAVGSVPWDRLSAFPGAANCPAGQVVKGVQMGLAGAILTCGPSVVSLDNILNGSANQTIRHNGTNWIADSFLTNTGYAIGINVASSSPSFTLDVNGSVGPHLNNGYDLGSLELSWKSIYAKSMYAMGNLGVGTSTSPDFMVETAGSIGPNKNMMYDLGSDPLRWRTIYAYNIDALGDIRLNMTPGSVLFVNSNHMIGEDNDHFFYDQAGKSLGIGTKTPSEALDVVGNIKLPQTASNATNYTAGSIKIGTMSINSYGGYVAGEGDTNTFIGTLSGLIKEITYKDQFRYNTGIGFGTLSHMEVTGSGNFGINNTAIGAASMFNNTDGAWNVGVGDASLYSNRGATDNTALGSSALFSNSENGASNNTAVGSNSMVTNASGYDNVAVGYYALSANTGGVENIAIGSLAGSSNVNNSYNIFLGYQSGLYATGDNNTYIGQYSGKNVTGSNNIFIGYNTGWGSGVNLSDRLYVDSGAAGEMSSNKALLYGVFRSAGTPSLRTNGSFMVTPLNTTFSANFSPESGGLYSHNNHAYDESANRYYRGINSDFCTKYPTPNGDTCARVFYVDGLLICTRKGTDCNTICATTLSVCCENQVNNCQQ
ncbi:MAG: hypothetical protein WCO55_04160 [Candidatus Falkowbacteria bacterium]